MTRAMRKPLPATWAAVLLAAAGLDAALPASAAEPPAAGLRYRIKPLPLPDGFRVEEVTGINEHGAVVGTLRRIRGTSYAFTWQDGHLTLYGGPPDNQEAHGNAINDRGDVAGQATTGGFRRAVLYRDGGMAELNAGFPSPAIAAEAMDVNNSGVSTGWVQDAQDLHIRTFIHDGSTARVLEIEGAYNHVGVDINEAGDVLLGDGIRSGLGPAYLYRDGVAVRLPWLDGGGTTYYQALNNVGQVLGNRRSFGGGPVRMEWFIWRDGEVQFGHVPDGGEAAARTFNDQGWIAGAWIGHLGFIHRDGQTHALEDLTNPAFAGRWRGGDVTAINEAGQLAGIGNFFHHARAFIATPVPEPATVVLMLAGMCVLGWRVQARQQQAPSQKSAL